jgi:hypothetical protein
MTKCFLCKEHFKKSSKHAIAEVEKTKEQQQNKRRTIRAVVCQFCQTHPSVIKYKVVIQGIQSQWYINEKHVPQQ